MSLDRSTPAVAPLGAVRRRFHKGGSAAAAPLENAGARFPIGLARDGAWPVWQSGLAALLLVLLAHLVYRALENRGFFNGIGLDYGIFAATARVVADRGWGHLYDVSEAARVLAAEFEPYYGRTAGALIFGPSPYPAAVMLPFLATNLFGPLGGFAAWTAFNLFLTGAMVHGLLRDTPRDRPTAYALALVFAPISYALFMGQLSIVMTFGLYRAYTAFERGDDARAGAWLGLFWIKPQYAILPALILLFKRRFRALGGLMAVGLLLAGSTVALVGAEGVQDYLAVARRFSGFRDVPVIVYPICMVNVRGVLVNLLPATIDDGAGQALTLALSALLALGLIAVWRGEWAPKSERFPRQILMTMLFVVMTAYHSHLPGASLLLVPMLAIVAGHSEGRGPAPPLWLLGLVFVPMIDLVGEDELVHLSRWMIAMMALALAALWAEDRAARAQRERSRLGSAT